MLAAHFLKMLVMIFQTTWSHITFLIFSMYNYFKIKHNRSLKFTVQGPEYYGPPLMHSFIL
jgi:hypothetical protein